MEENSEMIEFKNNLKKNIHEFRRNRKKKLFPRDNLNCEMILENMEEK